MTVHMQDLLTTDEAAIYLRLSERKLYELVANGAVPCTKVTGRWLFPRAALDRWVMAGLIASSVLTSAALSARVGMEAQSWPVTAPGASPGPSLMTGVPA